MTPDARRMLREKPQLIADDLRARILAGELTDGSALGLETGLIDQYGVSRPCLREALRILETEGLVTVVRGSRGGVVAHAPDGRVAARMAAMVLQARSVPLADVHDARAYIEPFAARVIAERARRRQAVAALADLVSLQEQSIEDPAEFGDLNAAFHHQLVASVGNETLTILTGVLDEILTRSISVSHLASSQSVATRQLGVRSQRRLLELVLEGDGSGAEAHWRAHLSGVGKVLLGDHGSLVVDQTNLET